MENKIKKNSFTGVVFQFFGIVVVFVFLFITLDTLFSLVGFEDAFALLPLIVVVLVPSSFFIVERMRKYFEKKSQNASADNAVN